MSIHRFAACTVLSAILTVGCAPGDGLGDDVDGTGASAQGLYQNAMIVVDQSGTSYSTSAGKNCVYRTPLFGTVTTLTGACNSAGNVDGLPGTSRFNAPYGLALDDSGANLYVTDTGNSSVRRINTSTGRVTTVVTASAGLSAGTAAGFHIGAFGPRGLAMLDSDKLLITDGVNHVTWIYNSSAITYLAGYAGVAGDVDGTARAARFNTPDSASANNCNNASFFSTRCALIYEPTTGRRRMIDATGKVVTP